MSLDETVDLDQLTINTIRFLAVDMVEQAQSGHPGAPMGQAAMAYLLWTRYLRHNPANPDWPNRDRFVLSCGHASALLYSLLHLSGYGLSAAPGRVYTGASFPCAEPWRLLIFPTTRYLLWSFFGRLPSVRRTLGKNSKHPLYDDAELLPEPRVLRSRFIVGSTSAGVRRPHTQQLSDESLAAFPSRY